jgi:protein-tyrosine phosphatase
MAAVMFAAAALLLVLGNLVILTAWRVQAAAAAPAPFAVDDVRNFRVVDSQVWRGAAPSESSYRDLAAHGVRTIVDLRAEDDVHVDEALLEELGLRLVPIPIRDGQAPTAADVDLLLDAISTSPGPTYVHCGAGVGRTGAMIGAYRVATGAASPVEALRDNLQVGPPSLEQLAFVARLADGPRRLPAAVVAVSRLLDAPRRLWTYLE